ncbi:MAG TPA: Hsp20/alpha crystallin family protein [Burkholderiaceae bacterium]
MSALTRFDPMDEFFPEFFRRLARPLSFDAGLPAEIRLDVSENEKEYLVSAEVPGARKDDVRVEIDRNQVTISAEVRKDVEDKHADGGRALLRETWRGRTSRTFTLAQDVDDKAASAKLEDGVLRLTLPKRAGAASKLLSIQ